MSLCTKSAFHICPVHISQRTSEVFALLLLLLWASNWVSSQTHNHQQILAELSMAELKLLLKKQSLDGLLWISVIQPLSRIDLFRKIA